MPLPSPNLDDRDFSQLVEDARSRIAQRCPEWTDLTANDPGMVLLEVFAHLTEVMIYRLNRIPEKAYVEFLGLLGVRLQPPSAATVQLRFTLSSPLEQPLEIPKGTRVAAERSETESDAPVFTTTNVLVIEAGKTEGDVLAHHADLVIAEHAGTGSGMPGQSVRALRPPLVARTGDDLDLMVGVEATHEELDERAPAIEHNGKPYRIWREVENFSNLGPDRYVYIADRMQGTIVFAPAARLSDEGGALSEESTTLAQIPLANREIRLWYRCGGGPAGNVAAGSLTVLKDPIPGVEVTNPQPATGGQTAEPLENAVVRGPQEFFSLRRAVTARDFELVAESWGAVARARAITKAGLWAHARPGTVEILLVPDIPQRERVAGRVLLTDLKDRATETARTQIEDALNERRPLGTRCQVSWARYKGVHLRARVVAHRAENVDALKARVLERIHHTINPLPTPSAKSSGWPFGEALRAFHVYDMILREPGVRYVEQVGLAVDEVPEKDAGDIVADYFQPKTWYAGTGEILFRSVNDGDGWEPAGRFPGEAVQFSRAHVDRPGLVAVATRTEGETAGTRLHVSRDCGETWEAVAQLSLETRDLAWAQREATPVLLIATDKGLYELPLRPGSVPVQVLVDPEDPDRGFYSVTASKDIRGAVSVAVAAQSLDGVYLSTQAGAPNTFTHIGLKGDDVRVLTVQYDGPRSFLWAGTYASGGDAGKGCHRLELVGTESSVGKWRHYKDGWQGGSCRDLAFQGSTVLAATHRSGVLRLDLGKRDSKWEAPDVNCGLPLRDVGRLHPVDTVAVDPQSRQILAGGVEGIYRSKDVGVHYHMSSRRVFDEEVMIPQTWLFCSGEHEIEVVSEDEAR